MGGKLNATAVKRLYKEVKEFQAESSKPSSAGDIQLVLPNKEMLDEIFLDIRVADNPIYPSTYRLVVHPTPTYPFDPPEVKFVCSADYPVPLHPHIYSNGHICLDILYDGWSPAHTLHSIALSIQSMLQGNSLAERPPQDSRYCRTAPTNPLHTRWEFEDDTV